jgi:hypothetical protein
MVWYVAIVAILNIGLGYALAIYLRPANERRRATDFVAYSSYDDRGDYGARELPYERELESSVSS